MIWMSSLTFILKTENYLHCLKAVYKFWRTTQLTLSAEGKDAGHKTVLSKAWFTLTAVTQSLFARFCFSQIMWTWHVLVYWILHTCIVFLLFVLIKGVSHPDRLVQIIDVLNRSASAAANNFKYILSVVYIDDLPCRRLVKYNQQKYGRFYKQRSLLEGQRINCSNHKEGVKALEVAHSGLKTPKRLQPLAITEL